ncbi:fluoroquinolone export ABC transporter permease subunit [Paenibacillus chungangensis]|uniref:ABC transporter permease n=1 Tax=Paenibacillus chungangensis TaxID=696535 RepID=A0ABW3HS09_9BACL
MRAFSALTFDIRFQWRHGFYAVYMVVCAAYWLLVQFIPEPLREQAAVLLTFSDPSALGLLMAGGILLLERDQGIHGPLFASPLRIGEYLLAKAASLALLSLAAAWAIHLPAAGMPDAPLSFSLGVILTSTFMTLLSIGVGARHRTVNAFLLMSQLYALPFVLPLLRFFGIWDSPIMLLLPTEGTLTLLQSAYILPPPLKLLHAFAVLLLWNAAVYAWARTSYERYVLEREKARERQ